MIVFEARSSAGRTHCLYAHIVEALVGTGAI